MEFDANGLEVLDRASCMMLLRTEPIGRIGLSVGALPVVLPVNYAVWEEQIVLRTGTGGKLSAALLDAVVAFEVDRYDAERHTGWSVIAQGSSREITSVHELEAAWRLPLRSWSLLAEGRFIAVSTDMVSGRRIGG